MTAMQFPKQQYPPTYHNFLQLIGGGGVDTERSLHFNYSHQLSSLHFNYSHQLSRKSYKQLSCADKAQYKQQPSNC
jgi:hypothetical protein